MGFDKLLCATWRVDREEYGETSRKIATLRFLLEPQGVRMDHWSLSEGRRSRTYTFGDLFDLYEKALRGAPPAVRDPRELERLNRQAWAGG